MENYTTSPKDETFIAIKRLVVVLKGIVARQTFDTYADLVETLACECAKLGLAYDAEMLSKALDRLELGGRVRLVALPASLERHRTGKEQPPAEPIIGRADAARIYTAIMARYRREHPEPVSQPSATRPARPEHFPDLVEIL